MVKMRKIKHSFLSAFSETFYLGSQNATVVLQCSYVKLTLNM